MWGNEAYSKPDYCFFSLKQISNQGLGTENVRLLEE